MERLFQGNISDLSQRFELPKGLKLGGIYIAFQGVNQALQTLAISNLGQIQILKNAVQVDLFDFEKMCYLNNILGGSYPNVSAPGDAFFLGCLRSSYLFNDEKDNCLYTDPAQKWEILHNFPDATGTIVASGTVRYFAELADDSAAQHVMCRYNNHDLSINGDGTFNFDIRQENVRALMIENDTAITALSVYKDGKAFVNQIDRSDMYGLTQFRHKIETFSATTPYIFIDLNPTGENIGSLSDSVTLTVRSSAATTLKILVISQDQTPNALKSTMAVRTMHLEKKAQLKEMKGLVNIGAKIRSEK